MNTSPLQLTLPAMPRGYTNYRGASRWKDTNRQRYWEDCSVMTHEVIMARYKEFPLPAARFDIHLEVWKSKAYDADNIMGQLKWAFDWLIFRGILRDDNPKMLWFNSIPTFSERSQTKAAPRNRLYLTLWPCTTAQVIRYSEKGTL